MTAKIPLQNGDYAIVDKEDYERCMEHIWTIAQDKTVRTFVRKRTIHMTRFILRDVPDNRIVTFKNNNYLDFRKNNLQVASHKIRQIKMKAKSGTSKYKGVSWNKQGRNWRASIRVNGKAYNLGHYQSEDEAAIAYNEAAKKHFGEQAYINELGVDNRVKKTDFKKVKQTRRKTGESGYRGVTKNWGNYMAQINISKKKVYLGNYETPEQAAKAYDKKAYELYGDKAILNFPELIDEYKQEVKK